MEIAAAHGIHEGNREQPKLLRRVLRTNRAPHDAKVHYAPGEPSSNYVVTISEDERSVCE
jgi:hypothetical protein